MHELFLSTSSLVHLVIHNWQTHVSSILDRRHISVGEGRPSVGHNINKFQSEDYKSVGVINCLGSLDYSRLLWLNFPVLIISGLTDFGLGFGLFLGFRGLLVMF